MRRTRTTLDDILAEKDEFGLLDVKPSNNGSTTEASRISASFEEINRFVDHHGHEPGKGERKPSVTERMLQVRLKAFRDDPNLMTELAALDRHGLFREASAETAPPKSLDDILDTDDELLSGPAEDIFELRSTSRTRALSDRKAERKPCRDFDSFKPLLDACAADLASGRRRSLPFSREQEINAGDFFVLNGVMAYVAEVRDPHIRNGRKNARLRLIFDSGTEGENLLRSLATELYKDPNGRRISNPESGPLFGSEPETMAVASPTERITGCIYIVRSLSKDPQIARLGEHLFKIGFTTGRFEDRIRGAQDDPTFLLAPVRPVRTYDAINLNAGKFETLIHKFFAEARLDIEILDRFGKPFRPKEWFLVPLPVIERAIEMLLDGSIIRHRYDSSAVDIAPIR